MLASNISPETHFSAVIESKKSLYPHVALAVPSQGTLMIWLLTSRCQASDCDWFPGWGQPGPRRENRLFAFTKTTTLSVDREWFSIVSLLPICLYKLFKKELLCAMPEQPFYGSRFSHAFSFLPLCGSIAFDYDPLQFFVVGYRGNEVLLTSPWWLDQGYIMREDVVINLHVPLIIGDAFHAKGIVKKIYRDTAQAEMLYGLTLIRETPIDWPYEIQLSDNQQPTVTFKQSAPTLLSKGIRECILLKKSIAVYLKHLAVYFSRVTGLPREVYRRFNQFYFEDILTQIRGKIARLEAIEVSLPSVENMQMAPKLNFEELHTLIATELSLDLLNLAFDRSRHLSYIVAVKEVEEQLYWYHNLLLLAFETWRPQEDAQNLFHKILEHTHKPELTT